MENTQKIGMKKCFQYRILTSKCTDRTSNKVDLKSSDIIPTKTGG